MFKKQGFPFEADTYLNIYKTCNVGCPFCKFNKTAMFPIKNEIDFEKIKGLRVLVSYQTEPLPFADNTYTKCVIDNLHKQKASVLFLSRFPKKLIAILDAFNGNDIVGISISEPIKNNFKDIEQFLTSAKAKGLKTWLSIEPVETYEFAYSVLENFKDKADYLRVGKLDNTLNNSSSWNKIKTKLEKDFSQPNIFIKPCK